jgi:hypothetical protein
MPGVTVLGECPVSGYRGIGVLRYLGVEVFGYWGIGVLGYWFCR